MEKYELEDSLKEEIRSRTLGEGFIKLVQSVRRGGGRFRISLRPVEIGGERKYQAEMAEGRDVQVKNFDANGAAEGIEEIIAQKGARELHLITATGDLHIRVTKKGHVLVSRSAGVEREATVKPHDRVKNLPLAQFDSAAYLKAAGLADGEGRIRASMRGKYDQVNEFLKVVGEVVAPCAKAPSTSAVGTQAPMIFTRIGKWSMLPEGCTLKETETKAAAIKLTADGKLLMASNRGHDSIAFYAVNDDGTLTMKNVAKLTGKFPRDFELMPGEKFMVVGHKMSNEIQVYAFDREKCELKAVGEPIPCWRPLCFKFLK